MKLRKGDSVKVLSGKYRGKSGAILKVLPKRNMALVEKVNIAKKHKKKTQNEKDPGGIVEMEAPMPISKLQLICKNCGKFARVGFKIDEKGKKTRICKRCNKEI